MRTADALVAEAAAVLSDAGIESPRREARLLLGAVLKIDANVLALDGGRGVDDEAAAQFAGYVQRRAAQEPFAYITGRRDFWSLSLEVTPATLIPRPDTEILVETALDRVGQRGAALEVLDLGTGTGAILIALLSEMPVASGLGVDVSTAALEVARRNAVRNGVGARARFGRSSWWSHVRGQFDLVVSNPPYIPTGDIPGLAADVRDHEPILALDGGYDGLQPYRAIAAGIGKSLSDGGVLAVEVGQGQADDVAALWHHCGLRDIVISPDLAGIPRVVSATKR